LHELKVKYNRHPIYPIDKVYKGWYIKDMKQKVVELELRNESIARRYFLSDKSSSEIAKDYGITRQRIFKIAKDYAIKYGYPKE